MSEIKNRSAYFEYFIDNKYDAGIVLTGTEVKSLREGKASFNDSYCLINKGEVWIKNLHIAEYSHGTANNHEPLRERKLLLQKKKPSSRKRVTHWFPFGSILTKKNWQKWRSVSLRAKKCTINGKR